MRFIYALLLSLTLALSVQAVAGELNDYSAAAPQAYLVKVQEVITPATADFIRHHLEEAAEQKADVFVLALDTPGGLMDSMKMIIQDIIASPVPVVTYVSPSGAHAASAGTYIMYASHIAAMAPGTNLGAASPIMMDKPDADAKSVLESKMINDASAYIRGLAELRKRNMDWAEKAVREAVSLSASEALREKVVDAVEPDLPALLSKIDGREVKLGEVSARLKTKGAIIVKHEGSWREKLLSFITNPNITFLLLSLGAYGIIAEFSHPGAFFPGILGAICLLFAMYALNILPVNYVGLGLLFLGIGCMTAEAFTPSVGVLGVGGAIAFAMGASILFDAPALAVSPWLIAGVTLTSFGLLSFVLAVVVRTRRRPVTMGPETMAGAVGEIVDWHKSEGAVRVAGTVWKARGAEAFILKKGDRVKVLSVEGLIVVIEPQK